MDPLLVELLEEGDPAEEVEVILKLKTEEPVPDGVRIIARFGSIATCRLQRAAIPTTHSHPSVLSVKAPRLLGVGDEPDDAEIWPEGPLPQDIPRHAEGASGKGTVVGLVDWGCDFAHPNLRRADGRTRLLAIWNQADGVMPGLAPYGYGRLHSAAEIDAALTAANPYAALGYHPSRSDPTGQGSHGTHVADIAAGGGFAPGSIRGAAADADLVFVHLAARDTTGFANLGDTVRILEALDFIARTAGDRPWVANMSIGRCGGPHDGLTLVEQGIDALVHEAPGRAVVQSTGNYYSARTHAHGVVRPGERRTLRWETDRADVTPNELEVWYSGRDRFLVEIAGPGDVTPVLLPLGSRGSIVSGEKEVGRAYHRAFDPLNGDHHLDILLDPGAPPGIWKITLGSEDLVDGRFHAWVERDAACPGCQSRLLAEDADPTGSTGTICNGFRSIAVGSYDAGNAARPLARFSSRGPTRDGRRKPDLIAPGVGVLAARSQPEDRQAVTLLTRKSGTSMAAPLVAGTIACMFEAAGRPLAISETRQMVLGATDPWPADPDRDGAGSGFLNPNAAVRRAQGLSDAGSSAPTAALVLPDELELAEEFMSPDGELEADEGFPEEEAEEEPMSAETEFESVGPVIPDVVRGVPSHQLVANAGAAVQSLLSDLGAPRHLFDAIQRGAGPAADRMVLLAAPGRQLAAALEPGDLLLRRGYAEPGAAHVAVLTSGQMLTRREAVAANLAPERAGTGRYVTVVDLTGNTRRSCARQVIDPRGLIPPGQMVVRLRRKPLWLEEPGEQQVPAAPAAPAAPLPAYGGYDLQFGDRDSQRRWAGAVRVPPAIVPGVGQRGFVAQLQRDLRECGIHLAPSPPTGRFDENTRLAVRELQLHAKLASIAQQTLPIPPGLHYSDSLAAVANPSQYTGRVSGVVNADTRTQLQSWIAGRFRCPVVIEAWDMRQGVRFRLRHANLWRHTDLQNTAPRMFAVDHSTRYTFPAARVATNRQVLGDFVNAGVGGPQSTPPNHTWTEAEILPNQVLFPQPGGAVPTLNQLTVPQLSTFKVLRAVSEVECEGFYDGMNAWDNVFISVGHFHTPLGAVDWNDGGELGAVLALFRHLEPTAYDDMFGFCGIVPRRTWGTHGATLFSAGGQRRYSSRLTLETETGSAALPLGTSSNIRNQYHWFRSWHWFYRFAMAGRTSEPFQRALWAYARVRLRELLSTPWDGVMTVGVPATPGQRLATIGDFYTSERAVALIMRWHVRFPAHIASGGVAGTHLRSAFRHSGINLPGDPLGWALPDEAGLVTGIFDEIQAQITAATTAGNAALIRRWTGLRMTMTNVRHFPVWAPVAQNPNGGQRNSRGYALDPAIGPLSEARTLNTSFPLDTAGLPPSP